MVEYLADRIANDYLDYKEVIKKYPQYKAEIDEILGIVG